MHFYITMLAKFEHGSHFVFISFRLTKVFPINIMISIKLIVSQVEFGMMCLLVIIKRMQQRRWPLCISQMRWLNLLKLPFHKLAQELKSKLLTEPIDDTSLYEIPYKQRCLESIAHATAWVDCLSEILWEFYRLDDFLSWW